MNWDDIRIFLAVARSGQILGAARRLGLNHTTVARRLTALETALSTTLLTRRTNGSTLTQAGEEFLLAAERMEAEMLAARSQVGNADIAVSGTVRIGAPDGFGVNFLAPRLARLTQKYPDLTIQLVPVPRSFSLSRREADIAITVERPEQGRLIARRLVDYTLGLYAHRRYLEENGTPESPEDLPGTGSSAMWRISSSTRRSPMHRKSAATGNRPLKCRALWDRSRPCGPVRASAFFTPSSPVPIPTLCPCCRTG